MPYVTEVVRKWGKEPWLDLLRACNRSALDAYRTVVKHQPAAAPQWALTGLSQNAELADLKFWVDVQDATTDDLVVPRIVDALSRHAAADGATDGAAEIEPVRLWIIGAAGTGKTTVLYETYFRYLDARANNTAAVHGPEPFLIQPKNLDTDLVRRLNGEVADGDGANDSFIRRVASVWMRKRGLLTKKAADFDLLAESLENCLQAGSVIPFFDGFDEIHRMQIQISLTDELFQRSRHFVCASRTESYTERVRERVVQLSTYWPLATVREYLRKRIPSDTLAIGDAITRFIRFLPNSQRAWLQNPRYLNLLLNYYLSRPHGDVDADGLVRAANEGEYALLRVLLAGAIDRVRPMAETPANPAMHKFGAELEARLGIVARAQLMDGEYSVVNATVDTDIYWQALIRATDLLSVRADATAYHFQLVNFTLVDFFLTRDTADQIAAPTGRLELTYLWSSSLLRLVRTVLRQKLTLDGALAAAWRALESRTPRLSSTLPPAARFHETVRGTDKSYQAVNLFHLAVQLQGDKEQAKSDTGSFVVAVTGRDLRDFDLEDAEMAKIAFNECKFDRSILSGGKGEGAQFTACSFKNCNFRAFDAGQAVFTNCSFDLGSVDDAPGAFDEMVVQGTNFVPRQEETIQALLARGAVENRSRYMGPFGESFMQRQGEWLGAALEAPEEAYVKQIEDFLKLNVAREHVTMVELMAGGSNARLLRLLAGEGKGASNAAAQAAYENVRVLAIDRDTRFLRPLREELGSRLRIGRWTINGRFGLAEKLRTSFKDDPTSEADIIIGKKALHELPCDAQAELIAECAEVLRPGGILTIFADAPDALSPEGRQRLNDLISPLRTGEISDAQFRECYLNDLTFGDTPDDAAVFSILWIALKDWANKNWNELHRRYYSTAEEIVTWATTTAGLEPTLVSEAYPYWVSARRFNEIGFNKIGRYLEQHSGKIATADHPLLKDWIAGGPHHALFFQFNDHHLWDSTRDRPTALGAKLLARRGQVDFRGLHPALGELVLGPQYDQALGFALRAKVFTFRKNGRPD